MASADDSDDIEIMHVETAPAAAAKPWLNPSMARNLKTAVIAATREIAAAKLGQSSYSRDTERDSSPALISNSRKRARPSSFPDASHMPSDDELFHPIGSAAVWKTFSLFKACPTAAYCHGCHKKLTFHESGTTSNLLNHQRTCAPSQRLLQSMSPDTTSGIRAMKRIRVPKVADVPSETTNTSTVRLNHGISGATASAPAATSSANGGVTAGTTVHMSAPESVAMNMQYTMEPLTLADTSRPGVSENGGASSSALLTFRQFLVGSSVSWTLLEDDRFRAFIASLAPHFSLPDRMGSYAMIDSYYNAATDIICQQLRSARSICITSDAASTPIGDCMPLIRIHLLSDDWRLTSIAVGLNVLDEDSTSLAIQPVLAEAVQRWTNDKYFLAGISEGARDALSPFALVKDTDIVPDLLRCTCLHLQLAVAHALDLEEVTAVIDRVRDIVASLLESPDAMERLQALRAARSAADVVAASVAASGTASAISSKLAHNGKNMLSFPVGDILASTASHSATQFQDTARGRGRSAQAVMPSPLQAQSQARLSLQARSEALILDTPSVESASDPDLSQPLRTIQGHATRWVSSFQMLKRFQQWYPCIEELCHDQAAQWMQELLDSSEMQQIEGLVLLLEPLVDAIALLSRSPPRQSAPSSAGYSTNPPGTPVALHGSVNGVSVSASFASARSAGHASGITGPGASRSKTEIVSTNSGNGSLVDYVNGQYLPSQHLHQHPAGASAALSSNVSAVQSTANTLSILTSHDREDASTVESHHSALDRSGMSSSSDPFRDEAESAGGVANRNLSTVWPTLLALSRFLRGSTSDQSPLPDWSSPLHDPLVKEVRARLPDELRSPDRVQRPFRWLALATVLDPRYKRLFPFDPATRDWVWALLRRETTVLFPTAAAAEPTDLLAAALNQPPAFNLLQTIQGPGTESAGDLDGATVEVARYLTFPDAPLDSDPLDWWRNEEKHFPKLSGMARRFLSLPASDAACERVLKHHSYDVSPLRLPVRHLTEKADKTIFLQLNRKFLERCARDF